MKRSFNLNFTKYYDLQVKINPPVTLKYFAQVNGHLDYNTTAVKLTGLSNNINV